MFNQTGYISHRARLTNANHHMKKRIFTTEFAGKTLSAEFNDLAAHANGSVLLTYGETVVLVTAVMSNKISGAPYFPLSVEYEEKFYAAGQILGSRFQRREGRPSDEATLSARIVDRTIRPLFNHAIRHDIQIVISVLAIGEDDPDVASVIGSSLALAVSDIPWQGPVAAVRLGRTRTDGAVLVNPVYSARVDGLLSTEMMVCGQAGLINMIETAGEEVPEDSISELLTLALREHSTIESWQREIVTSIGVPKRVVEFETIPQETINLYVNNFAIRLVETIWSGQAGKDHLYAVQKDFVTAAMESGCSEGLASRYFEERIDEELHRGAVEEGKRADGRGLDDVRALYAQAGGISPVLHGSGIFYRGGTHIFSALTLGGPEAAQIIDTVESHDARKRFMHHYNFPPFSVGETGRVGGFNRRMIGHGALAEKALVPVIPSQTDFPYTIRLVSETLSSNGSSSMGSVCASSLALMDGGVPITRPVAGIASGAMITNEGHALLTDIQGPEDEFGDMDFKVAGTSVGITAIQMDVKVSGISVNLLTEALEKARIARLHILETMVAAIAIPRAHVSPRAPEIVVVRIKPEQIGLVIGGGGKTIKNIKETTGVDEITIEEDGVVYITGKGGTAAVAAEKIRLLTKVFEVGEMTIATITRLATFGAFAKLDSYNEGLIHISEIAPFRLETMDGVLKEGEEVPVIVTKVEDGKIGLSIKRADPDFAAKRGLKGPA